MDQTKPNPVPCFQWLRLFAALGVVVIHVCSTHWSAVPADSAEWKALAIWDSLVRWPVPVFVMITGALFLPRVTTLRAVLTRYIPRIAGAFCLWSLVYTFWGHRQGTPDPELQVLLFRGEYHLWYLPFLCGIYLVLPFVQRIVSDRKLEDQLLAVSLVIGLMIPWLSDLGAALHPEQGDVIRALKNNLNYTFFFDLLAYLVLGHWLWTRELSPGVRRLICLLGLFGLLLNGPATLWLSRKLGAPATLFFDHASPTTLCAAAGLFLFARQHLTKLPRVVDALARQSFGVYLCHVLVLHILMEQQLHALSYDPAWFVPVLSVLVFAISLGGSALLSLVGRVMRALAYTIRQKICL